MLNDIRRGAWFVAKHARYVSVRREMVPRYALSIARECNTTTTAFVPHGEWSNEKAVEFIVLWNAVNFGSGYFPFVKKRDGVSGSRSLLASFSEWFGNGEGVSLRQLQDVSAEDVARMLGQPLAGHTKELMGLYAAAWRELSVFVRGEFGDCATLVNSARRAAQRLVPTMCRMPLWNDVSKYKDRQIPFLKRAQVLVGDLYLTFGGRGYGAFNDISRLTLFADNLIPHVLRVDGVLEYEGSLLRSIERGDQLRSGSPQETEIRASAIYATELFVEDAARDGISLTPWQIAYSLWMRGQQARYKTRPRHRCMCTYY